MSKREMREAKIVRTWRKVLRRAADTKPRQRFKEDAREILEFYHGPHTKLFIDAEGWHSFEEAAQVTVNKTHQYVAIIGPTLYNNNPARTVTEKRDRVMSRALSSVLSDYLNYTPDETNLRREGRLFVDESLIHGRGCLVTEIQEETGLVRSRYQPIDNIQIDPDAERLEEALWIARKKRMPIWEVRDLYGERAEGIEPDKLAKGEFQEIEGDDPYSGGMDIERTAGDTNRLVTVWEIWSKMGLGFRSKMSGYDEDLAYTEQINDEDAPPDENDYKYIVIAGSKHEKPLHIGNWPVPFYLDGEWPFTFLDYHTIPREIWPIAPLKPALGIQKALDFAASFLVEKSKHHSRHLLGCDEDVYDTVEEIIREGTDVPLIRIPRSMDGRSLSDYLDWYKPPDMGQDLMQVAQMLEKLFEEQTGLTEILYGMTDKAFRSAEEAKLKDRNSRLRIDDMAGEVEYAMTRAARKEAILALFMLDGDEVEKVVGADKIYAWTFDVTYFGEPVDIDQLIEMAPEVEDYLETEEEAMAAVEGLMARVMADPMTAMGWSVTPAPVTASRVWNDMITLMDTEDIVREFHYRIENGSARRPDRNWQIDMLNMMYEKAAVIALENGDFDTYNQFLEGQYDVLGIPLSKRIFVNPPPPPPPEAGGVIPGPGAVPTAGVA